MPQFALDSSWQCTKSTNSVSREFKRVIHSTHFHHSAHACGISCRANVYYSKQTFFKLDKHEVVQYHKEVHLSYAVLLAEVRA